MGGFLGEFDMAVRLVCNLVLLSSVRIERCLRGKEIKKRTALLYSRTRLEFGITSMATYSSRKEAWEL